MTRHSLRSNRSRRSPPPPAHETGHKVHQADHQPRRNREDQTPSHSSPAPDISPERGTAAAESVQATLAESPANPFLYSRNLDSFFHALAAQQSANAAPDTTIRILQFGDSHTAADYYTGAVRDALQSRFGNGGLGYQFPGHPFPGYRLAGSSRSQTSGWITDGNHFTHLGDGYVGLGGLSISTERPDESVTLSTTCTTLQVQYLRQPERRPSPLHRQRRLHLRHRHQPGRPSEPTPPSPARPAP